MAKKFNDTGLCIPDKHYMADTSKKLMDNTFHTQRLILIPFQPEDVELFLQINTDPFVRKYLWDDSIISQEQAEEILTLNSQLIQNEGTGLWKIKLKENEEVIGYTGLWYFFEESQPQLLYVLLPEFTGNGYAKEAAALIIAYAYETLKFAYVEAACDPPNQASQRLAESLGMEFFRRGFDGGKETWFYRK